MSRERHTEAVSQILQSCIKHWKPFFHYSKCVKVFSNDLKMLVFSLFISVLFENLNPNRMLCQCLLFALGTLSAKPTEEEFPFSCLVMTRTLY